MSADIDTDANRAKILQGAAALYNALSCIGHRESSDHQLAKFVVENELEIRAVLDFVNLYMAAHPTDNALMQKLKACIEEN